MLYLSKVYHGDVAWCAESEDRLQYGGCGLSKGRKHFFA